MKERKHSAEYFERAQKSLIGGVSSPFRRSLPAVLYFQDGNGAVLYDVDGNSYLDYALAWGPLILGHKHPALVSALREAAERPHNYGAQHELEFLVAEAVCGMVPCAERVALTSSGSEAVQLAMRLARAFTGRSLILKFEGHYHGWMDSALFSYHPRLEEMGPAQHPNVVPGSRGQLSNAGENILVLPWNDAEQVAELFARRGHEIAAIINEPVLCNSGCLMPAPGFLADLRRISREHGALLIFDEIITGFRMAPGGGQSVFGITPDLATFGKAIAAGLPLSAVAGRKDILELMVSGGVAFGGTFNGNCLSLAAARVSLEELSRDGGAQLKKANQHGEELMRGISALARAKGIPVQVTGFGTAFSVHFTERTSLKDYRDTLSDDRNLLREWLSESLEEGIYLLPDGRMYTSIAHTSTNVEETLKGFERVLDRWVAKRSSSVQGA